MPFPVIDKPAPFVVDWVTVIPAAADTFPVKVVAPVTPNVPPNETAPVWVVVPPTDILFVTVSAFRVAVPEVDKAANEVVPVIPSVEPRETAPDKVVAFVTVRAFRVAVPEVLIVSVLKPDPVPALVKLIPLPFEVPVRTKAVAVDVTVFVPPPLTVIPTAAPLLEEAPAPPVTVIPWPAAAVVAAVPPRTVIPAPPGVAPEAAPPETESPTPPDVPEMEKAGFPAPPVSESAE